MTITIKSIGELIGDGSIVAIQDGNHGAKHPKAADYVAQGGVPFVMASDFPGGNLDLRQVTLLRKEVADALRIGFAKPGDVLLTHKGTVGSTGIVPDGFEYVMLTPQVTYYRTNPLRLLNSYLRSAFRSPAFQAQLSSISAQSTRPFVSISTQRALRLPIPSLSEQRRIAGILSAYDDLIDNCERRIRVLDEMARALYREWFVDFRYPGHEKDLLVESALGPIPQGWWATTIGTMCAFLSRGITPKYDDAGPSLVINQKCVRDQRLDLGPARRQSKPIPDERRVCAGDILINSTGVGTLGRVAAVIEDLGSITVDTHVTIARATKDVNPTFFGAALMALQATFEQKGVGATGQTELSRAAVADIPIVLAPRDRQMQFGAVVQPIRLLTLGLQKRAGNLRTTRDLLLPRLLSGQLSLEHAA